MQSNWAPAHSKALREYFNRGMSYAAIARAINAEFRTAYTRNAALSRAARMGLVGTGKSRDETKPPPIEAASRLHRIRERSDSLPWRLPPVFKATESASLRCANVAPRHLSLTDLARGDCRYPYGGDADGEAVTFCGHRRRRGSSYCAAHFDLSRGPGTAAERSADRILLKASRAAWATDQTDQADVREACREFVNIDYSRE
jgi:GcrA cell cycle regulator